MSGEEVDPRVQQAVDRLLSRYPDVDAVLLSTSDGVPLLQSVRPSTSLDQLPVDQFQTRFSAIFSMTAEQARKMGHGHCKSLVVFFQGLTLVHIHLSPLVLTLVATDPTANVGVLMDSQPFFEEALRPIRAAIEQHDS